MLPVNPAPKSKIIAYTTGTVGDPRLVCASHHPTTILGAFEQDDLEPGERCTECGNPPGVDTTMNALVAATEELVVRGGYAEAIYQEEKDDVAEAHRRGLTVTQWRAQVEDAVAYYESPEYAQDVWERQGEEYAAELDAQGSGARAGGRGAIMFGDGAHQAMIEMLQVAAQGHWLVSVLPDGQDPDAADALLVMVDEVDAEGLRGRLVDADGKPAEEPTVFDWISHPAVVVH